MKQSIILKPLGQNKPSSTSNLLKKTMQVTAFTFSCLVALPSFLQTADAQSDPDYSSGPLCEYNDVDCNDDGEVIAWGSGSNQHWSDDIDWDWVIYPTGDYPPGCDEYGCDDGGGTDNGGNPETRQECVDLDAQRDSSCIFDPIGPTRYNWNALANSFANNLTNLIPASGGMWATASPSFYHGLISSISVNYWFNQTYNSTNDLYWDYVSDYCISEFPIIDNGFLNFAPDRMTCMARAYWASFTLMPSYSDSTYTIDTLEASLGGSRASFSFTIQHLSAGDPLGNWGYNYFNQVIKVKQCKVWFDLKEELGCE